jgi:WD40 repeat protein
VKMNIQELLKARELGHSSRPIIENGTFVRRLALSKVLGNIPDVGHNGCVNCLDWSRDGNFLVSGSDDSALILWQPDAATEMLVKLPTGHRANIFSCKFINETTGNAATVATCSGDWQTRVFNLDRREPLHVFKCWRERVKRISPVPDSASFLVCAEDGSVRFFDLRQPHTCSSYCSNNLTSLYGYSGVDLHTIAVNPIFPHLFLVAGTSNSVFLHDLRHPSTPIKKYTPRILHAEMVHVTCVKWCEDGRSFLGNWEHAIYKFDVDDVEVIDRKHWNLETERVEVSIDSESVEMAEADFDMYDSDSDDSDWSEYDSPVVPQLHKDLRDTPEVKSHSGYYIGSTNIRTVKDVTVLGSYVCAGSDCGKIFIWPLANKRGLHPITPLQILRADEDVVNVVEARPGYGATYFASSGIDDTVKIWQPLYPSPSSIVRWIQAKQNSFANKVLSRYAYQEATPNSSLRVPFPSSLTTTRKGQLPRSPSAMPLLSRKSRIGDDDYM